MIYAHKERWLTPPRHYGDCMRCLLRGDDMAMTLLRAITADAATPLMRRQRAAITPAPPRSRRATPRRAPPHHVTAGGAARRRFLRARAPRQRAHALAFCATRKIIDEMRTMPPAAADFYYRAGAWWRHLSGDYWWLPPHTLLMRQCLRFIIDIYDDDLLRRWFQRCRHAYALRQRAQYATPLWG